jgi:superfamily II DNA/RNA helicase
MIGLADTGSGKTLAYAVPIVLAGKRDVVAEGRDARDPTVLILAPTRELVLQIESQMTSFCSAQSGLKCLAVYGGVPRPPQLRALRAGVDIVVATPGRLLDLAAGGAVSLSKVACVVLDEADRMLSMGFEAQVKDLLSQVLLHSKASRCSTA